MNSIDSVRSQHERCLDEFPVLGTSMSPITPDMERPISRHLHLWSTASDLFLEACALACSRSSQICPGCRGCILSVIDVFLLRFGEL